jgi:hypothetical protein
MTDFIKALDDERTRIEDRITTIHKEREALDDELIKLQAELRAMDAYKQAKEGKPTKARTTRGPRKGGVSQSVKNIIISHPNGLGRAEVIEAMSAKEDKKAQASISQALMNLKKKGEITSKDGKYMPA